MDPTRLLVTFGASPSLQDHLYGNTALHWAVTARNVTAVQTLVKAGADTAVTNKQVHRHHRRHQQTGTPTLASPTNRYADTTAVTNKQIHRHS